MVFNVKSLNKMIACSGVVEDMGETSDLGMYVAIVSSYKLSARIDSIFRVKVKFIHPKGPIDASFVVKVEQDGSVAILFPNFDDLRNGKENYDYSLFYPIKCEDVTTRQHCSVYAFNSMGYDAIPARCQIEYFFDLI